MVAQMSSPAATGPSRIAPTAIAGLVGVIVLAITVGWILFSLSLAPAGAPAGIGSAFGLYLFMAVALALAVAMLALLLRSDRARGK